MNKCIFLDRDGVINKDRSTYTWKLKDFMIIPGVKEALKKFKDGGFLLIVITNQAGISKGLYTKKEMEACHRYMVESTGNTIDDIYFSSYYPEYSNSLLRKPDSLMFEKAIAKHNIDPEVSWMVGNSSRDLIPAQKLGMKTAFIGKNPEDHNVDYYARDLRTVADLILDNH